MTPTNSPALEAERRIVINRCYGNPVPRRNQSDNSTDMSSFPFVRHHFLRAGFEVIDCPPLTAQLKNSADIRMVMDVRDMLTHDTYFDEFVILSADADFTPVLHRLRSHARRTVIFSNDHTAAPYTAICDAEIREADLPVAADRRPADQPERSRAEPQALPSAASIEALRTEILTEVANARARRRPAGAARGTGRSLRAHARSREDRRRRLGRHGELPRPARRAACPRTSASRRNPPYFVYDAKRAVQTDAPRIETRTATRIDPQADIARPEPIRADRGRSRCSAPSRRCSVRNQLSEPAAAQAGAPAPTQRGPLAPAQPEALSGQPGQVPPAGCRACSGPPRAPRPSSSRSRASMKRARRRRCRRRTTARCSTSWRRRSPPTASPAQQTLLNIVKRAESVGIEIRRDDVRFVLDVVSEADPWFDQGASPSLFASRFRNFVVARCRGQGLNLSADELDLIEAWFAAPVAQRGAAAAAQGGYAPSRQPQQGMAGFGPTQDPAAQGPGPVPSEGIRADRWWSLDDGRQPGPEQQLPARAGRVPTHHPHAPAGISPPSSSADK